jgi:hypothetical protein
MARMSNRDRIARAAEEARLTDEGKVAKKAKKKVAKRPSRAQAKDVRMKIVWVVCNSHGKAVKTFAYPDKDAGTSEAQKLSQSTGFPHVLRSAKVPMD